MKRILFLFLVLLIVSVQFAFSQVKKANEFAGKWKGSSLCQVKNSPCHDEIVVYHISQTGTDSTYAIQANKIVNGVEEDMGILNGVYNKTKKIFTCHYENKSGQKSLWEFHVNRNEMKGRLVLEKDNVLYRIIELKKVE
ncbi:MAG: hypothetical protein QM737_23190 [Ferruginibacter sp.]